MWGEQEQAESRGGRSKKEKLFVLYNNGENVIFWRKIEKIGI